MDITKDQLVLKGQAIIEALNTMSVKERENAVPAEAQAKGKLRLAA